jgi:hypothetical protein
MSPGSNFQTKDKTMAESNVKYAVKGNTLTITCDVSQASINKASPSSSGKTLAVGSTGGFVDVGNGLKLSLNLNVKNPNYTAG